VHKISNRDIAEHVASCLQLAILLEINAPKPGNVNRQANFHRTNYEHFLASAVAIAPSFKTATTKGILVAEGKLRYLRVGIGKIIEDAVERTNSWQHGGNTLLGTILLLSPIAVGAGKTLRENDGILDLAKLRTNTKSVTTSTTPEDAVAVYEAIDIAKPGGLSKVPSFDATEASSKQKILKTRTTLFNLFEISAKYDSIAYEWVNNYPLVFESGLPFLWEEVKRRDNINDAIVHSFLKLMSENPDTLIARKAGTRKAREISQRARQVLDQGGLSTLNGKEALMELDRNLRDPENNLNPGTTADLITATLALLILSGYRP
jgi:triphosphoribosyl-dephospho-CoA synthase